MLKLAGGKKSFKNAGFITRMCKKFTMIDPIITLFNKLVRPILEYCLPALNPSYGQYIERIEVLQYSFTRFLYSKFHYPYEEYNQRIMRLGLKSLVERHQIADVLFLHKVTHSSIHCSPTHGILVVNVVHVSRSHGCEVIRDLFS